MDSRNYYSILGIEPGASGNEIRWAYRRLAHRLHPDVSDDPGGELRFKAVTEAYRTLKSPAARRAYDRLPASAAAPSPGLWPHEADPLWLALFPWSFWMMFSG